jgi:hypothetical protein
MQILDTTTSDQLIFEWLRSEWWRLPVPGNKDLIDNPDLTDAGQNSQRLGLLNSYRHPIIGGLPRDIHPKWVNIEPEDLPNVYIVPTYDWFLDRGGTFLLTDTAANLKAGRGADLGGGHEIIRHHQEVDTKSQYLSDYDTATTTEVLLLIAPGEDGPYTIIDGTHRATALYLSYLQSPNMPWKGMLIADRRIANSRWYINSPQARWWIGQMGLFASQGRLW